MTVERLYIFCEGQTEESFANGALYSHFIHHCGTSLVPIVLPQKKGAIGHKGGWTDYSRTRTLIRNFMAEHHSDTTWFTTLFDLYAIPENFHDLASAPPGPPQQRVEALETSFAGDITDNKLWRFTAHLQLHEFEALLLAEPNQIKLSFPEQSNAIDDLIAEIRGTEPELINEGRDTAPSKRILKYLPEYKGQKASTGPIIAARIGLTTLRQRCPHFHNWLTEIEARLKD